jgi:exodeoxyribonuclease VII large subunit
VTATRLPAALGYRLSRSRDRLSGTVRALNAVSPLATLERGYAIVTRVPDGRVVTDAADVEAGNEIEARLARGRLRARVLPPRG